MCRSKYIMLEYYYNTESFFHCLVDIIANRFKIKQTEILDKIGDNSSSIIYKLKKLQILDNIITTELSAQLVYGMPSPTTIGTAYLAQEFMRDNVNTCNEILEIIRNIYSIRELTDLREVKQRCNHY